MSDILNRLPENTLSRSLHDIAQDSAEFKSRQRTTGRSGQLGYYPQSTDDWDLVVTFPTTPAYTALYAEYRLTFTSDGSQDFPIVLPQSDLRVNGTADANKIEMNSNGRYIYSVGGNVVQMYYLDDPDPIYFEDPDRSAWLIAFEYMGSVTVRIKARGISSTNGTWSLVRIA